MDTIALDTLSAIDSSLQFEDRMSLRLVCRRMRRLKTLRTICRTYMENLLKHTRDRNPGVTFTLTDIIYRTCIIWHEGVKSAQILTHADDNTAIAVAVKIVMTNGERHIVVYRDAGRIVVDRDKYKVHMGEHYIQQFSSRHINYYCGIPPPPKARPPQKVTSRADMSLLDSIHNEFRKRAIRRSWFSTANELPFL